MKKLLLLIFLFITFTAIPLFAETSNVTVEGSVSEQEYDFSLLYGDAIQNSVVNIDANYNLTDDARTNTFSIKRTSGNMNTALKVTVKIQTKNFEGTTIEGRFRQVTPVAPYVVLDYTNNGDDDAFLSYYDIIQSDDKTVTEFSFDVPAGPNTEEANVAGFYLAIDGNKDVPAGIFTSTVNVEFIF
ncbi:MAG: hypothetical protein M0P10_09715 [Sphaerochaetaceae bacterium]|jgi:hypothetical protein|nr:hypothetical protein [Sphaerochaetaceae bacterium]